MGYVIAGLLSVFGTGDAVDFVTHWDLDLNNKTIYEYSTLHDCKDALKYHVEVVELPENQLSCKISRKYGE